MRKYSQLPLTPVQREYVLQFMLCRGSAKRKKSRIAEIKE